MQLGKRRRGRARIPQNGEQFVWIWRGGRWGEGGGGEEEGGRRRGGGGESGGDPGELFAVLGNSHHPLGCRGGHF